MWAIERESTELVRHLLVSDASMAVDAAADPTGQKATLSVLELAERCAVPAVYELVWECHQAEVEAEKAEEAAAAESASGPVSSPSTASSAKTPKVSLRSAIVKESMLADLVTKLKVGTAADGEDPLGDREKLSPVNPLKSKLAGKLPPMADLLKKLQSDAGDDGDGHPEGGRDLTRVSRAMSKAAGAAVHVVSDARNKSVVGISKISPKLFSHNAPALFKSRSPSTHKPAAHEQPAHEPPTEVNGRL